MMSTFYRRRLASSVFIISIFFALGAVPANATAIGTAKSAGPSRYQAASLLAQINHVRRRFHLESARLETTYEKDVVTAAREKRDPTLPPLRAGRGAEYGVWGDWGLSGGATPSIAKVIDNLVYDDGWRGSATLNLSCTSPRAPGCNGHRRAILSRPPFGGARLFVDAAAIETTSGGYRIVSIAALLRWSA